MILATGAGVGAVEGAAHLDLLVILAAAALVALILQRIRMAVIPGYLITGVLVGPGALGLVSSPARLQEISHLAIVLLMFGIGLQLHLSALKHRFVRMLFAGVGACALCILAAIPIAGAFGLELPEAIAVCMAFSLSSTAVVMRVLAQRHALTKVSGRLCLSILVVQDIAVLAMFAAIPTLAGWAGGGSVEALDDGAWWSAAVGWERLFLDQGLRFGGVVLLILLFRFLAPCVLRESLRARSLEVLTITSLAVALSLAVAVQTLGFSLEMGAFLAGFLLAGTPFRHHLTGQIRPLRDILIAVFFTTVGMKLDPRFLADAWLYIAAGVVLLITLKSVAIAIVCWSLGTTTRVSLTVGCALAQAGEFSLVFVDVASLQGLLSRSTAQTAIAIVVVSLILTPALIQLGPRLGAICAQIDVAPWFRQSAMDDDLDAAQEGVASAAQHVIVAGYGFVGRCIVDNLEKAGVEVIVVELNHETVRREARAGRSFVFGDVSSEEVLDSLRLEGAGAVVLTMPDDDAVLRTCMSVRRRRKDLLVIARTALISRCRAAIQAGADYVTVDEMACAETMLGMVTSRLERAGCLREPDSVAATPVGTTVGS